MSTYKILESSFHSTLNKIGIFILIYPCTVLFYTFTFSQVNPEPLRRSYATDLRQTTITNLVANKVIPKY